MEIKRVSIESIHLDPANARLHDDINLDAIIGSLQRFGQAEPLVIQASTGRIIGGNGRLVAMKKLGWTECDIVEVDVDDMTATALGIALNRTAELADWDDTTLARLLQDLRTEDSLEGVGFCDDEIDQLLEDLAQQTGPADGLTDPDDIPEPPDDAVTQIGDLWILGNHRLLCANSGDPGDVDRLLDGAEIHLVNTDPPYNVKVEPRSKNAIAAGLSSFSAPNKGKGGHHQRFDAERLGGDVKATTQKMRAKDRPLENDFVSDEEFERLLDAWFGNIARALVPGRGFYIWGGYANCGNYPPVLKHHKLYFSQAIIWVKEHPVLTRKDFMGNHEWCFYGWKEGAGHKYFGPKNALDVWPVKKVNPQSMIHLTEKPVELARRAIEYSSRRNENVLDLFGGSGSTLIAAEQTARNAYLMEIDPLYCDIIVNRWETFSGNKAVLEFSGQSFAEVSARRTHTVKEPQHAEKETAL